MTSPQTIIAESHHLDMINAAIEAGDEITARMQLAEFVERFGLDGRFGDKIKEYLKSLDSHSNKDDHDTPQMPLL